MPGPRSSSRLPWIAAFSLLFGLYPTGATAGLGPLEEFELTLPRAYESLESPEANRFPFDLADGGSNAHRYQQAYSAEVFREELGDDRLVIHSLLFRPDAAGNAFDLVLGDVTIQLATTFFTLTTLNTSPDANLGNDTLTVFDGDLPLSSSFTGSGPRDFDIRIDFQTPFVYDPLVGDLVVDVTLPAPGEASLMDYATGSEEVSRVWSPFLSGANGTVQTGNGLVTRFVVTRFVPEPSRTALGLSAVLALLALVRRRAQAPGPESRDT